MFKAFRKIKPRLLLVHMIVTLCYPAARALRAPEGRLLLFTDAMTVTGLLLVAAGAAYALWLHGDFDIAGFALRRGAREGEKTDFRAWMADAKEKREEAFNYPLFLGLVYLLVSAILAYALW